MANPTMTLIASNTVGSGGASSVTFSSIPATYTDLVVKYSVRVSTNTIGLQMAFNGSSANYSAKFLEGSGSSADSYNSTTLAGYDNSGTYTANTFGNGEIYISNYTSANYKSISSDSVVENNATLGLQALVAGLWSNTAAITSLTFTSDNSANFVQYSTFYLYGISSS